MKHENHPYRFLSKFLGVLALTLVGVTQAETSVDISDLNDWSGIEMQTPDSETGQPTATLGAPGEIRFTYPDGPRGWYLHGLQDIHDGSADWRSIYGLRFDIYLDRSELLEGEITLTTVPLKFGSSNVVFDYSAPFHVAGAGWHTVTVPLDTLDMEKDKPSVLYAIKSVKVSAGYADQTPGTLKIRGIEPVKADRIAIETPVRSKSAKGGEVVEYELNLTNVLDTPQAVTLTQSVRGREEMKTTLSPDSLVLSPREAKTVKVRVAVSERIAPGGREVQVINVVGNGQSAGQIEFITPGYLEHPYILHTPERWDAVQKKIENHAWAKAEADKVIAAANRWEVPQLKRGLVSVDSKQEYVFPNNEANHLHNAAIAYQLTGELEHAEKVALYLKRLSDPQEGYMRTRQASKGLLVAEGNVFQRVGIAYDLIYNTGLLSESDHANLEKCFRIYFDIVDEHIARGTFSNWAVSEYLGAIYCALAIQDLAVVERFVEGPTGFYDTVTHGILSDGWWFECSIGYNTWVAKMFTELSLALKPWGVDYLDAAFPASYSLEYNIPYASVDQRMQDYYGKPFQKYGPVHRPYVKIKDMWDALVPYIDFNGVMFAVNDSREMEFQDNAYELAYAVYGDPIYASIIKLSGKRDLIYGVPELPDDSPNLGEGSAFSDNAGVVMLRSKAEGKHPREKIQAVMKYGTHGGYHGHFDRAGLNSLMRYGRSFYNPRHIWYSYPNYMYAFFVQTSLPHNMVVVDMKQQEPVDSRKLLFNESDLIQATAVETNARWSNPPYGGLAYANYFGRPFRDKVWDEGRFIPQPEAEPRWGSIGEYSDYRVMQRRLMAVTDDYVVLADYLSSPESHTFDCLFQIKGFQGIDAEEVELVRHTESMNPNPVLAAQFITDCDWYQTSGTTKVSFETQFGPEADNVGTELFGPDGVLKMDVYNAWPREREVMIGTLPEAHRVSRQFWYTVEGDGDTLAEGKFGAWILGREQIDVSVEGLDQLRLTTKYSNPSYLKRHKTLFWGDPVLVMADGSEKQLSEFDLAYDQIDTDAEPGKDYYGGPVKIAGQRVTHHVPANPSGEDTLGTVTLDLTGLDAVRFKTSVGGDYPMGDETWRRKSLSFRTTGNQTRYLTVIEPYEGKKTIKQVTATSADQLTVEFIDGRKHELTIDNLEVGEGLSIAIKEYLDGELISADQSR